MHVIEFQGAGARSVGLQAAGDPVASISNLLEDATVRWNNRPVLLAAGAYMLATAGLIEQEPAVWHETAGGLYGWDQLHAVLVQDRMLEPSGIELYRVRFNSAEEPQKFGNGEGTTWDEVLRTRLLQFRAELCRAGLEQMRRHLSGRISGGQSTLQHQLVKGMVADVLTTLYMTETLPQDQYLSAKPDLPLRRVHAWIHQELDEAFRQIQRLGGGFGFLRQGVSSYIYTSQLVKNMLLLTGEEDYR
ncbi:hypothetical protein ACFVQB_24230 [Paenibacillus sp. NPDC057886]|uniref:hypothetical protein n=1 Tax=Paenibacillus sp. NPDC057886 TaxID=3346270 RepID=UPI00369F0C64